MNDVNDAISRQAAIDVLRDWEMCYDWDEHCREEPKEPWVVSPSDVINKLPPIQPKRGKWILGRSGAYCCSECMEPCATYVMMKPRDKFCKMCGSRNEVTE